MVATQDVVSKETTNQRKYRSPNRILARSFRIARDKWKQKYMDARADLKRSRQLATERGNSRDRWRAKYDAAKEQARTAEMLAQERLQELEQLRARELEVKKSGSTGFRVRGVEKGGHVGVFCSFGKRLQKKEPTCPTAYCTMGLEFGATSTTGRTIGKVR
jgi:hypothetical protein